MIRFSAFLVVVAVGLLVAGVVTSKLLLVYIAIGVSGVALLALGIGAVVNWRELTGKPTTARPGTVEPGTVETSAQGPAPQTAVPERVTAPAAAGAGQHRRDTRRCGARGVRLARYHPSPSGHPRSATCRPEPPPAAPGGAGRAPGARCLGAARRCDPAPDLPGPALRRLRPGPPSPLRPPRRGSRAIPRAPAGRAQPRSRSPRRPAATSGAPARAPGLPEARATHLTPADREARPVPRRALVGCPPSGDQPPATDQPPAAPQDEAEPATVASKAEPPSEPASRVQVSSESKSAPEPAAGRRPRTGFRSRFGIRARTDACPRHHHRRQRSRDVAGRPA